MPLLCLLGSAYGHMSAFFYFLQELICSSAMACHTFCLLHNSAISCLFIIIYKCSNLLLTSIQVNWYLFVPCEFGWALCIIKLFAHGSINLIFELGWIKTHSIHWKSSICPMKNHVFIVPSTSNQMDFDTVNLILADERKECIWKKKCTHELVLSRKF